MKKSIDLDATFLAMFTINKAFKVKFKKYWGTTFVDGVEVFNERFTYFKNRTASYTLNTVGVQRMLKVLGIKKKINEAVDDFQGIESAWLLINADKVPENQVEDLTLELLATRIESTYEVEKWYNSQVTLDVTADASTIFPNGVLNKANAMAWIVTTLQAAMPRGILSATEQDEADEEFSPNPLSKYVLLDVNNDVFEWVATDVVLTRHGTNGMAACLSYKFKRVALVVDGQTEYLNKVHAYVKARLPEVAATLSNTAWSGEVVNIAEEDKVTNDLFYKGYLRASTIDLPRSKFSALVMAAMDSGYAKVKKKRKWYQKLLAIVVFVVVVWVSWGAAAPAAGAVTASTIAVAATYAALGLALAQMVFAKAGYADLVGFYGRFVKVLGIVSAATGIGAAIQNIAREGLLTYLKGAASMTLQNTMKMVNTAVNMWSKNVLGRIDNSNNSLRDKIKQQEEELYAMYDKEYNLPLEAIEWQSNQLKMDNTQFEVDYLYEPTKMNICRRSFF